MSKVEVTNLTGTLRVARRGAPDRVAVVSLREGMSATYRDLDERSDRMATGLLGLGLAPGDRLALWLETSLSHVLLYLAAAKAGLVVVPVNERYTASEAAHLLDDSGSRALAFGSAMAPLVDDMGLRGSLVLVASGRPVAASFPLESLERGTSRPGAPRVERATEDPYILGYTSGTTGKPKGAVLTHRGVLNIARTNAIGYRLPMGSVGLYTASMTYTATVPAFILTHFYLAGTVILCPRRDPDTVIDAIARHHVNYTHLPPPLVDDFAAEFARRTDAIRTLTSVLQGAGKVSARRLAPLNDALSGRLVLGWGMTENSGGLVTATTEADMRRALDGEESVLDSVGGPVPGTEVAVRDDGELVVRSSSLMSGYWRSDANPFQDGWFHTGDMGRVDPDGLVHIQERRDDLIVSGGMNVYPTEVEDVLRMLPDVADCAVVGIPDDRLGQTVVAYVSRRPGATLTEADLIAHCRSRLASFKKPTAIRFGDTVPRTLSGKVKRFEVRSLFDPG